MLIKSFQEFFSDERTKVDGLGAIWLMTMTAAAALAGAFFGFDCLWPEIMK